MFRSPPASSSRQSVHLVSGPGAFSGNQSVFSFLFLLTTDGARRNENKSKLLLLYSYGLTPFPRYTLYAPSPESIRCMFFIKTSSARRWYSFVAPDQCIVMIAFSSDQRGEEEGSGSGETTLRLEEVSDVERGRAKRKDALKSCCSNS